MKRYLTLSAAIHGLALAALTLWGGRVLVQGRPEVTRVRIIDERPRDPGAGDGAAATREAAPAAEAVASAKTAPQRPAPPPEPAMAREAVPRPAAKRAPSPADRNLPAAARVSRGAATAAAEAPSPARTRVAASAPAGGPGGAGGGEAARASRIAQIHARIQAALFYPREARRRGLEGTVHLRFDIRRNGRVRHVAVRRSSGERLLDRAGVETLRRAEPLPFVEGDLEIPVVFHLTRGR